MRLSGYGVERQYSKTSCRSICRAMSSKVRQDRRSSAVSCTPGSGRSASMPSRSGVEKVLESLELIKNHKVWFQVVDRGAGDELAQFADEAVPARSEVAVGSAVRVLEFSCAGFQPFAQRSPVRSGGVRDSVGERPA